MKVGYKKLLFFLSVLFIIVLTNTFLFYFLSDYKIILMLLISLIIFNFVFIFEKDNHRYMSDIILEIVFYVILYFILYYLLGLIVGLAKTPNYFTLRGLRLFIAPTILYCIIKEFFRYNLLCKADGNKICTIFVVCLLILLDITNDYNFVNFENQYDILKFVALLVLPAITKNISYSYISKKMGYKPVIIFDLIFSLYPYIIPILPNPNEYLMSIIYLLVPVLFAFRILWFFEVKKDDKLPSNYHKKQFKGILLPIITIGAIVYFYSGYFRFYSVAIASGSMNPKIKIGDVVIVDQKYPRMQLKKGDVIAFRHNDVIIVHRIYKKIKINGEYIYYTKGDANNHVDDFYSEEKDIIGKVNKKISYIGYPTVWFNKEGDFNGN